MILVQKEGEYDTILYVPVTMVERRDEKSGRFLPGNMTGHGNRGAKHMVTRLWEALERYSQDTQTTVDREVIAAWVERAKRGDMKAVELLMAYTSGKPPQPITGFDGGPIATSIQVSFAPVQKLPTPIDVSPQVEAENP